ncbi:hypothetical protein [Streptomyces sp. NPDC001380]|uniref:hypothetical protein n=1 Tax=Streptomyces sp. NPDC001380 TaxID=3364566 RepID=UPI0036C25542
MTEQEGGAAPQRVPADDTARVPDGTDGTDATDGPAAPQEAQEPARLRRRPSPRLWAVLSVLLVAGLAAALWVDRSDGSSLLGGSQDAAPGSPSGPGPAASASADPDAFTADRYFPASRGVDEGSDQASRTAARQGADCADTVRGGTAGRIARIGCTGYVGATYTRLDGAVLTTVTVLRFKDDQGARKAALTLGAHPADLAFEPAPGPAGGPSPAAVSPSTAPAATPAVTDPAALFTRVAAVRGYVTVTSSAFRDGHRPTGADRQQLEDATRAVAHTAGAQLMWL